MEKICQKSKKENGSRKEINPISFFLMRKNSRRLQPKLCCNREIDGNVPPWHQEETSTLEQTEYHTFYCGNKQRKRGAPL
jgi:hypothetical protein